MKPFLFFISYLLPLVLSWSSGPTAKLGCPTHCGDVLIPYPFGIGSNCSQNHHLNITCDNSTGQPMAMIERSPPAQAIEINETEIRIVSSVASTCFTTNNTSAVVAFGMTSPPFSVSTKNWVTGIGCYVVASAQGAASGSGCMSYCPQNPSGNASCVEATNGYTSGTGCCRTPLSIAYDDSYVMIALSGSMFLGPQFTCGYAFIGEVQPNFVYPLQNLSNVSLFINGTKPTTPLVLNWRVGLENCSSPIFRRGYACQNNTVCIDVDPKSNAGLEGYLCQCMNGYEGNPYLDSGCTDIDECAKSTTNDCSSSAICINTPGSYQCLCPRGYYGTDSSGTGCHRKHNLGLIILGIGLGSGMGFVLLLLTCFCLSKMMRKIKDQKRRAKYFKKNGGLILQQQTDGHGQVRIKLYDVQELCKATDNFHIARMLGRGGQGTVYKGILSDGKMVAVKMAKLANKDQVEEFINEIVILSQINHKNVVKLLGCCLEMEVPLIVYEFIPNGTLHELLHDTDNEFPVPWNMRLKMAAEISGAIAYLHSASSTPIYHRDIKSSNILLDERYIAKVSDFGISKMIAEDQTHLTTCVKGTIGYLDPEYFQTNQYTEKSDVYSFGVVLVELLIGQKPISSNATTEQGSLITRFLQAMASNQIENILDPQVSEQDKMAEVVAVAQLARRCLNLTGILRPTMKEVGLGLENLRKSEMPATTITDEVDQVRSWHESKLSTLSDTEYWTGSSNIYLPSSPNDMSPLMYSKS